MSLKEITVGEYKLMFNQGWKYVSGMRFEGPCIPQNMAETLAHSDCVGHMYPLSADEFSEIYKIINSNRTDKTKTSMMDKISEKLKKEFYMGLTYDYEMNSGELAA
jgi:hypothetical protein